MAPVTTLLATLGFVGCLYWLIAGAAVRRFVRSPVAPIAPPAPVTVLKPLHGETAELYENLRSFCSQNHPCFQVIFGVRDPSDSAIPIARRLIAEFPDRDFTLVIDPSVSGSNFKVSNLEN